MTAAAIPLPMEFYVTGGTLPLEASSYVERQADADLYNALHTSETCYVLNSRQMGKSSLCVRTIGKLEPEQVRTVFCDLTKFGSKNLSAEQWYASLLNEIGRELGLRTQFAAYWKAHSEIAPVQRLFGAIVEVGLDADTSPIVIFVDEIDVTLSLPFSTDEFFAAIRQCYVGRVTEERLQRLTFCLVGTAAPADLIQDAKITPFNIGTRIVLRDFTPHEAASLAAGLPGNKQREQLLARVLYWTSGHPYLTQRLCAALTDAAANGRNITLNDVDKLCNDLFLAHAARESDDNLAFVRNQMLKSDADITALLSLYKQVRAGKGVRDDETNALCSVLKLSGIVKVMDGALQTRNRIYAQVFNQEWIEQHMPDAEARRQREAYLQGVRRTLALAGSILAVMGGLIVFALMQLKNARHGWDAAKQNLKLADERLALVNKRFYEQYEEAHRSGSSSTFLQIYAPAQYSEWLKEAGEGKAIPELFVARCYDEGIVVPKNKAAALHWAILSAEHGNTFAMNLLGSFYDEGEAIAKDHAQAMLWWRKAAEQGNGRAMLNLGNMCADEKAAKPDYAQARQWYQQAANSGYAEGFRKIGELYAYGHGVKKNPAEVTKWYQIAADAGDSEAAGKLLADRIAPAFKSYVAKNATEHSRNMALATVRETLPEFMAWGLEAADNVLENTDVEEAVAKLRKGGSMSSLLAVYNKMVEYYIRDYNRASIQQKKANINTFAYCTQAQVEKWYRDRKYEDVSAFWERNYEGLPIETLMDGEKDSLIIQMGLCVNALFKAKQRQKGKQLLDTTLALCDKILVDRPWDWYTKVAYMRLCFRVASTLSAVGEKESVQPLLRRAWGVSLKMHGKEALLKRYAQLPLDDGKIPAGASEDDASFFRTFAPGVSAKGTDADIVSFIIPIDFSGKKEPFKVYLPKGTHAYAEFEEQVRWLKEYRSGIVPQAVLDSFKELHDIAVEKK